VRFLRSQAAKHPLWNLWPHAVKTLRPSPPASYGSMQITQEFVSSASSEPP
jgi:hypothetical protein